MRMLMLWVALSCTPLMAQELVERTVAIVGGTVITLTDVRTAMALGFVETTEEAVALEALIQRALILREVERYAPPEPGAGQIMERRGQLGAGLGPQELDGILAAGGFTESRLRAWLRDDLRIAAYLDQRFAADGPERRQGLIEEWVSDLRRRAPVVELWKR